jgi:hypothetical protein
MTDIYVTGANYSIALKLFFVLNVLGVVGICFSRMHHYSTRLSLPVCDTVCISSRRLKIDADSGFRILFDYLNWQKSRRESPIKASK